jgi:hypothetical protein
MTVLWLGWHYHITSYHVHIGLQIYIPYYLISEKKIKPNGIPHILHILNFNIAYN